MSALLAFDTHTYVKRLVSAGMPEPQAEVIADEQRNLITNELATKRDLKELETRLTRDIAEVKRDIRESEQRTIIRLGSMMVVAVGVVAALVKLL